jgi:hypothetical protein
MSRILAILLFCAALAACANGERLPVARGPLFALNPGLWQPAPADLAQPPQVGPR